MLDLNALGISGKTVIPDEFKKHSESVLTEYMQQCECQSPEELLEVLKRASAVCLFFRRGLLAGEIRIHRVNI